MNAHKRILMVLGIAFVLVPHISKALDTEGTAIIKKLTDAYVEYFTQNKILTETDRTKWKATIADSFYNYVRRNATVAGVKDTLLETSLSNLLRTNTDMLIAISTSISDKNQNLVTDLKIDVENLERIKSAIETIEMKLKKESYYISSKKNAKEALLIVLEFMRGAAATAIAQIKNILSGY